MSTDSRSDHSLRSVLYSKFRPFRGLCLVGFVILSVVYVFLAWLKIAPAPIDLPEEPGPMIGFIAASIALLTYLLRRWTRQNRIRKSLYAELNQHQKIYKGFSEEDLGNLNSDSFRHTIFPLEIFNNLVAEFGYLSAHEVEALSRYYTTAQRFKEAISMIDSGDDDTDRLLNLDKDCTLIEQLENEVDEALKAIGHPQQKRDD